MNLLAAYLDRTGHFARLRRVFEASARAVMPGAHLDIRDLAAGDPLRVHKGRRLDINRSFIVAAEAAIASPRPVAVCDLDLLFLRSIADAWDRPFDLAVTVRQTPMRYNTGLYFVRPNERSRAFLAEWIALSRYFERHEASEVERWGGVDQAALARAVARHRGGAEILELPCREWNSTQSEWARFTPATRVLHVKSQLRRACFGSEPPPRGLEWAVDLWHRYERAAA